MQTLWQDLRYGVRVLLKQPGFTLIAVLTLALGIGANGVIFSLINALLLRPLPVEQPQELAAVFTSDFSSGDFGGSSYPDYADFRARNQSFTGLVSYQPQPLSLNVDGANERAFGEIVSGNYFTVLGLKLALGRGFLPEEELRPGAAAVAVISHKLWQTRFNSDPATVGRNVKLNGQPFTIVGVAPANYGGLLRGLAVDWWVPAMMADQLVPGSRNLTERGNRGIFVMGRLKPGVTVAQAQAEFNNLAAQLYQEWPQQWDNIRRQGRKVSLIPESEARVMPGVRTPLVIFTALLMTVVGLVLLIACANVANLLLARAAARRKEIAIRLSLGAGRGRLIQQLLTESVLLALLGGVAGLALATWGADLLMAFKPPVPFPLELNLHGDWRVFGFMFGLSLLTGVVFGLVPALAASRPDVTHALKDDSGASSGRGRLRGALVVVQVALSLLLLICAGLFLRSLRNASSIDPGFDADNLLAMSMDLQQQGYDETRGKIFIEQLLDRTRALPGVISASLADDLPLGLGGSRRSVTIEGYAAQAGEDMEIHSSTVAPGYVETLRIPLLQGRTFAAQDRPEAPGVVLINEAFARRYWPGQPPLGKRIQMGGGPNGANDAPYLTVVGVVKDGKYTSLGEEATPFLYLNLAQRYVAAPTLIIRTQSNPTDLLATVRNEVAALDKSLPLFDVKTMRQHLGIALLPARLAGSVLGIFGLVALLLAAAGIYGVMAYAVAQRTREIGIRMALGADARAVLRLVVRQGMTLVLIGLAIGLTAAFALTHLLKSLLFGVSTADPLTFAGIALLLMSVALLACWIPARRATKVDPLIALRCE
ncbi:MAG: ABC transporter permease [Acidobacteria bacterium]|nr:ABC transporter permease [Acidobacteriota bacterium]MBI3422706.1 ABC transporter permease [Acidobacteriota bacterium]